MSIATVLDALREANMVDACQAKVRTFLRAKIVFNNRMSTIDCVIRKLSDEGALIDLCGALAVPEHFELEIPVKGKRHLCRLVARDDAHASLLFEGESGPDCEDLMAEVRRLKKIVRALSGRLRELGEEGGLPA